MNEPTYEKTLSGWGRMRPERCRVYRPERRRGLAEAFERARENTVIARGLGRSYGDTAVNGGGDVLDMTRLNRMIAFEPESGVLECEAGVSLAEIIRAFLPRGYFLPVTPGTKFVTVGGAIANDIHGKNHHRDGAFGQHVEEIRLLVASGETVVCSPREEPEVFWATVGGVGLTGIILSAKIRLPRVETGYVLVDYQKTRNFEEALATMEASDADYQYSVAWIDCLAGGGSLGRAVLMRGNHAPRAALSGDKSVHPLRIPERRRTSIPVDFPSFVLNPVSIKAFNTAFYGKHRNAAGVLVDYDRYFYPLDAMNGWNRMYGKAGFAQYQATLPIGAEDGLRRLLEKLSQSRRASFLAVLKRFGPAGQGILSHPIAGFTLNLDLPNRQDLPVFLQELDAILLEFGGRVYLAKDIATLPDFFAAMYPRLEEFREIKHRLDPETRFSSTMARRLHLI